MTPVGGPSLPHHRPRSSGAVVINMAFDPSSVHDVMHDSPVA